MLEKASIFSALQLYLDFINLFLYLLRFLASPGIERAAEQRKEDLSHRQVLFSILFIDS